jgi:hypothetical protein
MHGRSNVPCSEGREDQLERTAADNPRLSNFCVCLTPDKHVITAKGDSHT